MKILYKGKDGGNLSTVTGYWLIECKSLFSIVLLKFEGNSRQAYHTHAFSSISWLLKGQLIEEFLNNSNTKNYTASWLPIFTSKDNFHKVSSIGVSWVLSFRGRWDSKWLENTHQEGTYTLHNGRIREEQINDK